MLKNLVIASIALFGYLTCNHIPTPQVENDKNWVTYICKDGMVLPNDIVKYYENHYPEYFSNNKQLMAILREQYENRISSILGTDKSFYTYSRITIESSSVKEKIDTLVLVDYNTSSFIINGCHDIDINDRYLFNRIYKWYNFGYSDGFYLNIWSDDDLFRKINVPKKLVESATLIVDCTIDIDDDIKSNELFFFDKSENYLFKIIVSQ